MHAEPEAFPVAPVRRRRWSRWGVAVLILVSGNPAVLYYPKEAVYLTTLFTMVVLWATGGTRFRARDGLVIAAFVLLSLSHLVVFGTDVLMSSAGFLVRLMAALFAIRAFPDFDESYVDVMCGLSVLSLLFHVPVLLGADVYGLFSSGRVMIEGWNARHIGIHNFMTAAEETRNAGMFGEPGMLAGYVVLALLFGALRKVKRGALVWGVLAATLATTLSTTGYAAGTVVALLATFTARSDSRALKVVRILVGVAALFLAGVFAYDEFAFLGDKIEHQFNEAASRSDMSKLNRFGNFMFDMEHLEERPIAGWSPLPRTRAVLDREIEDLVNGQGNGLSNFAVKFGIVGFLTYFGAAFARFRRESNGAVAFGACVVVAMLLTGEPYLNAPAFMVLMFDPSWRRGADEPRR